MPPKKLNFVTYKKRYEFEQLMNYLDEMYEYIIAKCRQEGFDVETGEFGADMKVSLQNDGPFTIVLDSNDIC